MHKAIRTHDNVQRMIKSKNKNFVVDKLSQNIGKSKKLWKLLKSLGLPSKQKLASFLCLKKDGNLSFDPETNAETFKGFYWNLANDLVKQLPTPPKKFRKEAIKNYYKMLKFNRKTFSFKSMNVATIQKLLREINPTKSVGTDNLAVKFLKEGEQVLAKPITESINLSISPYLLFQMTAK